MAELPSEIDSINRVVNDAGAANASNAQRRKKFIEESKEKKKDLTGGNKRSKQHATSNQITQEASGSEKKLPNERWKELGKYEQNFYVDIEIFLALENFLLKHLFDSTFELGQKQTRQMYVSLFALYRQFDKNQSFLLQLFQQTDYQEITEKNFPIIIKLLYDSICKDRNYFDNVAKLLVNTLEKQAENSNLVKQHKNKLFGLMLDQVLPGDICLKLIETYPTIISSKYLHINLIDFLDKLIVLPMQYITKLPLLFEELKKDTKGYDSEVQQLTKIQQRISITTKGTNNAQIATDFGNNPHLSTALPIRQQAQTLEHLKFGIAYIFQIVAYWKYWDFSENKEAAHLFVTLSENARHIFINISKTPGAIEILKEDVQKIKFLAGLPSELTSVLEHCLNLLEGDLTAKARIDSVLDEKIVAAKKLKDTNEAFLYCCATIIDWVIDEIKAIKVYGNTKNTLPAVKNITEFLPRFFSNPEGSISMLCGLQLKIFKNKLKKLKDYNYVQLNELIQSIELPYERNIAHLIIYLFAETSQFCSRKLSFTKIESLERLMALLKITNSFLNNQNQSSHQLIVDAYLKINTWKSSLPNTSDKHKNSLKLDILCLVNMLNIINTYCKSDEKNSVNDPVLMLKKMLIKLCFQLKRNEELNLPVEDLKLAIQKLIPCSSGDKTWLIPTLINLADKKLVPTLGAPLELLVNNLTWQNALHYLYKCILQQCTSFFIHYMESTTASTIKNRTTATAKQRYAIYCCEQLDELYKSELKIIKQKIETVGQPYSRSIIGLLKSELADWQNHFDERQRNSINTKGEITDQVIPAINAFFDELDSVISPKIDSQQPSSSIHH